MSRRKQSLWKADKGGEGICAMLKLSIVSRDVRARWISHEKCGLRGLEVLSYRGRVNRLELFSLGGDLIEVYKITRSMDRVNRQGLFPGVDALEKVVVSCLLELPQPMCRREIHNAVMDRVPGLQPSSTEGNVGYLFV
eukprot:g24208.t1